MYKLLIPVPQARSDLIFALALLTLHLRKQEKHCFVVRRRHHERGGGDGGGGHVEEDSIKYRSEEVGVDEVLKGGMRWSRWDGEICRLPRGCGDMRVSEVWEW
jgi:hypothetical protein